MFIAMIRSAVPAAAHVVIRRFTSVLQRGAYHPERIDDAHLDHVPVPALERVKTIVGAEPGQPGDHLGPVITRVGSDQEGRRGQHLAHHGDSGGVVARGFVDDRGALGRHPDLRGPA